jgi:N-acetylmuramoyl-L-alanine amidase
MVVMMSVEGLPLKRGDSGPAVRDLHQRLSRADARVSGEHFTDETYEAVRSFQESRRIEVDGIVGRHTWGALIEAAHRLGDRLLYHKSSPMLRGDDVSELQQRLGALGFDAGRVDGIFGPDTAKALANFQRNAGLPVDGILGPDGHAALRRLGGREAAANVAAVRERARMARLPAPRTCSIVVAELGGLGAVIDTCTRHLRHSGIQVEPLSHPDESHHARVSNKLGVDLYLGLVPDSEVRCSSCFFATTGFESFGGRQFARLLSQQLVDGAFGEPSVLGQRLPVLRETRMPAVVLRIGPPSALVQNASELGSAVATAVGLWSADPTGEKV